MHVEVDQSGKISDTQVPTVLAFSDGENFAILIPASVKRKCLHALRGRGKSGTTLYLRLFSTGLYLLLKSHLKQFDLVTMDVEYPGHNDKIKEHLLNLFARAKIRTHAPIRFEHIGKKSQAHQTALSVFKGKRKADRVITFAEMQSEL